MKAFILATVVSTCLADAVCAQRITTSDVPAAAKVALHQKYPAAKGVSWEREKGNYEANWGGTSGEDNSVLFTARGVFVALTVALPVAKLPAGVINYVRAHYGVARISEAGRVTDASGGTGYEAEVKGKDLLFDEKGNFIKID